jgi:LacI family transcriptional regulator
MAQTLLGSFSIDFGQEAARQLIRHPRLPDAVVCGSDLVTLGVVREFRQSGVAIPGMVKITGIRWHPAR